jgi:hypothetical protein
LLEQKRQEVFGVYVTNLIASMEKSGKIKRNKGAIDKLTQNQSLGN